MDANLIATFVLLVGLELVLGIDNILLISILTDRLPKERRARARYLGLGIALVLRLVLLLGASFLVQLEEPIIWHLSWKGIILIAGGGFLLFKSVKEIHEVVEKDHEDEGHDAGSSSIPSVITQIVILDLVFSIDSVITAVGLTDSLWVIYAAVTASFVLVLLFAGAIASFVQSHVTLKVLALSFLVTIGVTLVIEGMGGHVPKAYIYLPMGFGLMVELLHMRRSYNQKKRSSEQPETGGYSS